MDFSAPLNEDQHGLPIDDFLALAQNGWPVIDVRSPAEFRQGHIPGAHNIPLFDNEGRAEIGTLFKKSGREAAVLRGLALVGPSLTDFVARASAIAGPSRRLLVNCWRGGMRSGSFCWLMNMASLDAKTLSGGYKSFRRKVLAEFDLERKILIIGGMTGSGKSEALRALALRGAQVLDLETLACHKGSAFGALGESPQPTSEQFENDIFKWLTGFDRSQPLLMEDESRSIGQVGIPPLLFTRMQHSPMILLELPTSVRISRLVCDYGGFSTELLLESCLRIQKRLGGEKCRKAQELVTCGDLHGASAILLDYYDKAYSHQITKRNSSLITRLAISSPADSLELDKILAAASLISWTQAHPPAVPADD